VITVLIPTWNGATELPALLDALDSQSAAHARLAIDSSSSDSTRELLESRGFRVERIEQSAFGHGSTRNALVQIAQTEFVVFFSQDAQPQGSDFLERLVEALRRNPLAEGVSARVLPREDDDPLTARSVLSAPEAAARALSGEAAAAAFHNVAAAYRREALLRRPFPQIPFGEDQAWARAVVAGAGEILFEPAVTVRHSHRYSLQELYQRYRVDARFHRSVRGVRLRPDLLSLLRGLAFELREDWRFPGRTPRSLLRAPLHRAAQLLGQYRGSRGPLGAD